MISGFLVKKGQMTSIFTPDGKRIAVTKCVAQPLKVTQVKTVEKDGYTSVQVAYDSKKHIDTAVTAKLAPAVAIAAAAFNAVKNAVSAGPVSSALNSANA